MCAFLAKISFRLVSKDCFLKSLLRLHHGDRSFLHPNLINYFFNSKMVEFHHQLYQHLPHASSCRAAGLASSTASISQRLFLFKHFTHVLFIQKLFTQKLFLHILFTHIFSPIESSPKTLRKHIFNPYTFYLETLHPESLLAHTFHPHSFNPEILLAQIFHPKTLLTHTFRQYTFHPETLHPKTLLAHTFYSPRDSSPRNSSCTMVVQNARTCNLVLN